MSKNPSSSERIDLENFFARRQKEINNCFCDCEDALTYQESDLKSRGHKSREAAILYRVMEAKKRIDSLLNEHLRKYPD